MINQANNLGQVRASYSGAEGAAQQSQSDHMQQYALAKQRYESSRDVDLRIEALRLAISSDTPGDTVKRAETYYNFLKGSAA